jgi:hypothetical protein
MLLRAQTNAKDELIEILNSFKINEDQIIEGGGGLSSITQRLGGHISSKGWIKEKSIVNIMLEVRFWPQKVMRWIITSPLNKEIFASKLNGITKTLFTTGIWKIFGSFIKLAN